MKLLQYLSNESTPGYPNQTGIDWMVVWHYTIIIIVVLLCAFVAWMVVNFLFNQKWKENFVRAVMSGGFRRK
jgi:Flp pilus assembly protein TadB